MAIPGMRVKVEYADHTDIFAGCLPASGRLSHALTADNDPRPWWVVKLDVPLEYQLKVGEPHHYRLITARELVIGSRAQGDEIGLTQEAAVHILLPLIERATTGERLRSADFYQAAWGVCRRDDAA
jgi:hypothetical protein